MKMLHRLLIVALLPLFGGNAAASEFGTAEEAKAMADKAVVLIESEGVEKAYATFTAGEGGFKDRDLYVFVMDFNGVLLAHGANAKLVGKNIHGLKDPEGKLFAQDFIATAKQGGDGWVDYKWPNPVSKKVQQKSSYIKKAGDTLVGVGIYK